MTITYGFASDGFHTGGTTVTNELNNCAIRSTGGAGYTHYGYESEWKATDTLTGCTIDASCVEGYNTVAVHIIEEGHVMRLNGCTLRFGGGTNENFAITTPEMVAWPGTNLIYLNDTYFEPPTNGVVVRNPVGSLFYVSGGNWVPGNFSNPEYVTFAPVTTTPSGDTNIIDVWGAGIEGVNGKYHYSGLGTNIMGEGIPIWTNAPAWMTTFNVYTNAQVCPGSGTYDESWVIVMYAQGGKAGGFQAGYTSATTNLESGWTSVIAYGTNPAPYRVSWGYEPTVTGAFGGDARALTNLNGGALMSSSVESNALGVTTLELLSALDQPRRLAQAPAQGAWPQPSGMLWQSNQYLYWSYTVGGESNDAVLLAPLP